MPREVTEIIIDEKGAETHESWLRVRANTWTGSQTLFDSEIVHQHFVAVTVERVQRTRDLNRDWFYNTQLLIEWKMSQAQWGAFVSSFGDGGGVPATLSFLTGVGHVPEAPYEPRMAESTAEVKDAGDRALRGIQEAYESLREAFESGAGKKDMREKIRKLGIKVEQGPGNMKFAAESLNEHVENVVTKARADIEGMALAVAERSLEAGSAPFIPSLGDGS
jgi:hypothetical protein